jgi:hypothetical protein
MCVYCWATGSADLDQLDKPTNSLNEGETAAQRLPAFSGEQQGRELCVVAGRVPLWPCGSLVPHKLYCCHVCSHDHLDGTRDYVITRHGSHYGQVRRCDCCGTHSHAYPHDNNTQVPSVTARRLHNGLPAACYASWTSGHSVFGWVWHAVDNVLAAAQQRACSCAATC